MTNRYNTSMEFDIIVTCECGHDFRGEVSVSGNELTVAPCPDCLKEREERADKADVEIENLTDQIKELLNEKKELETAILNLSAKRSLNQESA